MAERSRDWIKQATRDLEVAKSLRESESYEWACFAAHQAAEKAVKAVFQKMNSVAWGHSVLELLKILSKRIPVDEEILNCARNLDRYYVPTRYPDSFDSGSPYEYFTEEDAENAILCGGRILEFCKGVLAQS